ncbi:proprotein convertase P-domain-containing protein [Bernardetia sp. MNP-M8]|uniref:proprotein convertase P-domain-containing protein n=1 Tax=Bernardetia sp. MNP-M8 TaxID=3127470 RepID=UPI0030D57E37
MKKIITIFFLMFFFFSWGIKAQNAANYTFSTNTTGSLTTGTGWATIIGTGQNHTTFNDGFGNVPVGSIVTIPFEVWFMGERFTSFSINTNGILRFGNIPILSEGNTYNIPDNARLSPFGASSTIGGVLDDGDWQTGEVRYKVIGTAPNRIMVVQCNNMRISYNSGASNSSFDMQIKETSRPTVSTDSGQITFLYGTMTKGTTGSITAGNIGIGYIDGVGNDFLSVDIANHTASTTATNNTYPNGTITQLNSNNNTSRRRYIFNPAAVIGQEIDLQASCLSSSSFILNWTDNATNEVGIVLYRSLDGVNYTFDRQLPANTTSTIITGLTPSTTYYYQVYAVTEGKLSALSTTGTVVITTLPASANAVYSRTNGVWNTASTWTTNAVPVASSDVIIGCIVPHTVDVNTPSVSNICRTLLVETGSILNFNAGQTLRVQGDVTNKGTINTNGGTLIIEGNLINTVGATVNIGNGTLIVQGNFQNANTATLSGNTGLFRLGGNFTNQGVYNANLSTMRFDGNAQQLINHTGTSTGQGITTVSNSYNNDAALATPAATNTYNNTTDVSIPDNNAAGINRTITVPTTFGTITNMTVDLDIDHTYVGDLIVTLTSPQGTTITLINRVTLGTGTCGRDNIDVRLSDAAGSTVQSQCTNPTAITGTRRPSQALSAFDGQNPSGDWILNISDRVGADVGAFRNVNLNITTTAYAGLAIPDNNNTTGVPHTINIPATANLISDVNLDIEINHTRIGDLYVRLISPTGTFRDLLANPLNGTGSCTGNSIRVTLDDQAADFVQNQCGAGVPSINGTYIPNQSLASFINENPSGNWTIRVYDLIGGNVGRIMSATLHITTSQLVSFPLSSTLYYHNLLMLNTGAGVRTQNTDINILNAATWTNGVFRADNDHKLIFVDNATSTIAINASHADMKVRKIGNDAFNFPVGNAGWGAPIGISAPSNINHHFTAQYTKQVTPFDPFSKEATIHHVGQCEYWILDRTNGNSNVVVTLSYDEIRSCTVGEENDLKVLRWDGSIWRDHFNGGLIATPYQGVLSLGTITNFSPFTLGADDEFTILPLTLLSFDAKPMENDAILDWTTIGELNHDYFEVERSFTGDNFERIGNIKNPIGRDNTKNTYSFVDKNVGIENREAYYRLKQIDTDGTFSYSDIKKVNWSINDSENQADFIAYPNPFTDILTLDFSLERQETVDIILTDMAGRSIKTISQSFQKGSQKIEFNNLQNLARGSYLIQLRTSTLQKTFKVVKM